MVGLVTRFFFVCVLIGYLYTSEHHNSNKKTNFGLKNRVIIKEIGADFYLAECVPERGKAWLHLTV